MDHQQLPSDSHIGLDSVSVHCRVLAPKEPDGDTQVQVKITTSDDSNPLPIPLALSLLVPGEAGCPDQVSQLVSNLSTTLSVPPTVSKSDRYVEEPCSPSVVLTDVIHGTIVVEGLTYDLFFTEETQRLRRIQQLGMCSSWFVNANGTRLEHSLGTYHLSKHLVRSLRLRQPELGLTERHEELVALGGFCHDLGHVLKSHLFDSAVVPRLIERHERDQDLSPDQMARLKRLGHHADRSVALFRYMLHRHGLEAKMTDAEITFVQDVILGQRGAYESRTSTSNATKTARGGSDVVSTCHSPARKTLEEELAPVCESSSMFPVFLLDVVCNTVDDLDTDKLDYLLRDTHYLGAAPHPPHIDLAALVRVHQGKLWYDWEARHHIGGLFEARFQLHQRFYQVEAIVVRDAMMTDILEASADYLGLTKLLIDPECAWTQLTDDVLERIRHDPASPARARELLRRIDTGPWYTAAHTSSPLLSHLEEESGEGLVREAAPGHEVGKAPGGNVGKVAQLSPHNVSAGECCKTTMCDTTDWSGARSGGLLPSSPPKLLHIDRAIRSFGGPRANYLETLPFYERVVHPATGRHSIRYIGPCPPANRPSTLRLRGFLTDP